MSLFDLLLAKQLNGGGGGGGAETDPVDDGKTHLFIYVPLDGFKYSMNISKKSGSGNQMEIDWGDGTIQTISSTPSHTYATKGDYEITMKVSSAGAYSCGAYTFSAESMTTASNSHLVPTLRRAYFYDPNLWLGTTSTTTQNNFNYAIAVKKIVISTPITSLDSGFAAQAFSLESIDLPSSLTSIGQNAFRYIKSLRKITIPRLVTSIGTYAFDYCTYLKELHMLPTTPPTIGSNSLRYTPSDMTIYVPTGTLADYQAATNWSTYASQMVEESV